MLSIRNGVHLPGRALQFTESNLASALENVRAHRPHLIVIDALFAQTPQGVAFVDRVEKLAIAHTDIRLVARVGGAWTTTPRRSAAVAVAEAPSAVSLNTRRAP